MNSSRLDHIARELCDLLQYQLDAIEGRSTNFSEVEYNAYEMRKRRIFDLRTELGTFVERT